MATIKKTKKKLRHITSLMPVYNWKVGKQYLFRMPYTYRDRDTFSAANSQIQIRTHLYKQPHKKVWANLKGNEFSYLPKEILLSNVVFGYTLVDNPELVIWVEGNKFHQIGSHILGSLMVKGIACEPQTLRKDYNPYEEYRKFTLDKLRHNRSIQISLHRIVDEYKRTASYYPEIYTNKWKEIQSVQINMWDKFIDTWTRDWMASFIDYTTSFPTFRIPYPIHALRFKTIIEKEQGAMMGIIIDNKIPFRWSIKELFHNGKNKFQMTNWVSRMIKDLAKNVDDSYQDSGWESRETEIALREVYNSMIKSDMPYYPDSF